MERRSTHKIRKTTFSKMLDICIKEHIADISAIRAIAGHVDESTLLKNYLFLLEKMKLPYLLTQHYLLQMLGNIWKHLHKK